MLLPNLDSLWNFSDPASTEAAFRKLLPLVQEDSSSESYRLELLTQIARTLGLQRKFDEAHATLDLVAAELRASLTLPRIRYLLERGRVWRSSGKPDRARPLFDEAWNVAKEAGEAFYAVDAAHMMAIVVPPAEALPWNLRALELAEASDEPRAKGWLGPLYNNIGWTYHDEGRFSEALDYFERGARWHEERKSGEPLRIARWAVARALRSLGRLEEALALQLKLLEQLEAEGKKDGFVWEEIAENLWTLGRRQEARAYFAYAYEELAKDDFLAKSEPQRLERLRSLATGGD